MKDNKGVYAVAIRELYPVECKIYIRKNLTEVHQLNMSLSNGWMVVSTGPILDRRRVNGDLENLEKKIISCIDIEKRGLFGEEGILFEISQYFKNISKKEAESGGRKS